MQGRNPALLPSLILAACAVSPACSSLGAGSDVPRSSGPQTLKLDPETWRATGASGEARLVETPSGRSVTLEQAVDALASADVVFLGEQHDNAEGHAVQLALTQALAERRGEIVLSMEMLERDAQPRLDLYLAGGIDEGSFTGGTRLWPNYVEHYRAAVEFCKERGFPVLAANVYRPIASAVAKRGLVAGVGDPWAARSVSAPRDGEYRERFNEVMGGHGEGMDASSLDNIFAAQCIKDDTMAESIAVALDRHPGAQVVHWNGRFHSDYGLGTVERLKGRRPDLNIAVVSMLEVEGLGQALTEDQLNQGHFIVLVVPD